MHTYGPCKYGIYERFFLSQFLFKCYIISVRMEKLKHIKHCM